MTETTTIIFRIDSDLKKAFENAAKARDRTPSQILRDYVRAEVDQHLKRTAQRDLPLKPPPITPQTQTESDFSTKKPKKGQKLAASKPANWKR